MPPPRGADRAAAGMPLGEARKELSAALSPNLDPLAIEMFLLTRWDGYTQEEARALVGATGMQAEAACKRFKRFLSDAARLERLFKRLGHS